MSKHEDFDEIDREELAEAQGERIAKRMSRAGFCSRRKAEELIEEGRVAVNGEVIDTPAIRVLPQDVISVDGKTIQKPEDTRLWLLHKPRGVVTTSHDPEGRPTVFSILPEDMPRVISIGRLDLNSEGLLLLTNDGELSRFMELPSTGWTRRYRVRVLGMPTQETLRQLKKGTTVEGIHYGSVTAKVEKQVDAANVWLEVSLTEGKNREIRRLFEHFGHKVNRLQRVSYGPFQLGNLKYGDVKEVPKSVLRTQLGSRFFNKQ